MRTLRMYLTVSYRIALGAIVCFTLAACGASQTAAPTAAPTKAPPLPTAAITQQPHISTPTATPQQPAPSSTPIEMLAALKGQVIQFWTVGEDGMDVFLKQLVNEFNQSNAWGVRVEFMFYNSAGRLDDSLAQALESKTLPDLVSGYSQDLQYWHARGIALADLEPYLANSGWGIAPEDQGDFYPVVWAQDLLLSPDRSQAPARLGLPWYRSGLVMLYNQSWAEAMGFDAPPATPAQFRQQACAAARANRSDTNGENDGTGGWLITPEPADMLSWLFAFGGQVMASGDQDYLFDTPASTDAFTYVYALYSEGCAWHSDTADPKTAFSTRQALFVALPLTELPSQQAALGKLADPDDWTILPFPSRRGGAIDIYGQSLAVIKSTWQKQMAAWLFTRWLVSSENQARWVLASGTLPTRASALTLLQDERSSLVQWQKALGLLPYAQVEPSDASWRVLRWAIIDAMKQLLSPGFRGEDIPALLKTLDELAEEVQAEVR